jgi:hypothetical protein
MKRFLLLISLIALLSGSASLAATSFDVAVGVRVNEDTRIFLNVANETWRPTAPTTILRRCANPEDDFPVIAFLAYQSHRSPDYILSLRQAGYDWSDIFFRLNVSPGVLFAGMDRDPGPPYGKAWGHWKREHVSYEGGRSRYRLSDRDVIALVKIQTAARHFGTSAYAVVHDRDGARRADVYAANRWRERHGRDTWSRDDNRDRHHRRDSERGDDHRDGDGERPRDHGGD